MENNVSSSDNSSYFADEESDEDSCQETTDLTSPISFGPSTSSSGFSFGCNYDVVEDGEGESRSRRASLPTTLLVERYKKAGCVSRSQSLDRGVETRRPLPWLKDTEIVDEPQPILTRSESLEIVEEAREALARRQSSEIVEQPRYLTGVDLTRGRKETIVDRSEPRQVFAVEKTCRRVEHSDTIKSQSVATKDTRKSNSRSKLEYYHFQRPNREGFKSYIKSLFPIHQLRDALRKRVVVRPENVLYFPQLSKPIELATSDYVLDLNLQYGVRRKQVILVETLDGLGGQHSRTFLATHNTKQPYNASCFLVLKSFRKIDGPVKLDTTSPRLTLRRELRVFKRLATLDDSVRRFVVGSAGVLENEQAHYVLMPSMYCDLLQVLLKKTKINKNVFAKAWIAQLGHGLNCLHNIGTIHRNLKPNNILVDWNGSIKITDFSCSYIEPFSTTSNTRLPQLVSSVCYAYRTRGTPEYMAPEVFDMADRSAIAKLGKTDFDEQVSGLKGYGKEVDVWALGCVAAEILRQRYGYKQLFERPGSREAFIWASQGEQFARLESFGIYGHLAVDLVHKMLQVKPGRRLQLNQMKDHLYYSFSASAKSFDGYLNTRYAKEKRLPLVLKTDLSAAPTSPDCVLKLSAKRSRGTRPSIDSDEGYTWINPFYLADD